MKIHVLKTPPSIRPWAHLLLAVLVIGAALALPAPASAAAHVGCPSDPETSPYPTLLHAEEPPHPATGEEEATPAEGEETTGEGKEEESEAWSVDEPPGQPSFDVEIDVHEGTWISLDVSPDGTEIVFDLLGDLYSLPIAGGEAKSLTAGLAWDEQPRYSPDGQHIVFTSDRAGGDNAWIIARDGSDPVQVTKEDFRLVNSPAWTPDGQYVAVRKHFTSERSAGAGEIWLYHRSGTSGLQMTERPNDQKDLGEPAFSPDGRYLYYSQDVTPGGVFQYNKDPNTQIYVIKRLDRETGETERLVTGLGGSIRPTPSPDGESLAFIRRIRGQSVLHVLDLTSGRETPLFDGLDRDMQETWAIHGVYPGIAWTPDSQSLIFWAGGKIQRLNVATREVSEIPFHVRDTRKFLKPIHSEQTVFTERFPVKLLRWVAVSPRGDQVAYQALGHIYIRPLPEGTPRRLTTQNDHFELYPTWSRDGQWIAYTTWNDDELGTVRVAPARGSGKGGATAGKVVTERPGHYHGPAFSPDGKSLVFLRAGGGGITSPLWSSEEGLYVIPLKADGSRGGAEKRIAENAFLPHFGAASDRVFFVAPAGGGSRALKSIGLDGSDERTHYTSENAEEVAVSPDGRWLAFVEYFNAYIAPFVDTGKAIEIGPGAKNLPVARVSKTAGEFVHFSGDSKTLHWSLGPELFSRDLKDAFAFLDGAPEELPEAPAEGRNISFEAVTDVPTGQVAFVGGRVITMKGDEVIEDGVVVVDGNRITAVGARGQVEVPAGAHVVDARGKTLMPGLVDVHWHGSQGENAITPQRNWFNYGALAFGVTTIHDPSNDTNEIFSAAELGRAGLITAPRIYSTGTILYGAKASIKAEIDSLDDARAHLARQKAKGAFSVKSYNQPRRDQRQQVLAAARELSMLVFPEGGSLFQHNMNMVADGHTGIEHSIPVAAIYDDVRQFWGATDVGYTPTLVVGYGGLWGEEYWYATTDVWKNERLLTFVPREQVDARARRRGIAPPEEWNHFHNARVAKELTDAGVAVNLGAHGQREGLAAHWELWMFVQGGMSPLEAIRASTLNGARYIGMGGEIGSLEAGKLADLIVIDGNPLEDIRVTEKVTYTMVGGRLYDAATMNEAGNHPRARGKLFWE